MNRKLLISILICFVGFNAVAAVAQTQKYEQQTETKLVILSRPQPIYNYKARKKALKAQSDYVLHSIQTAKSATL